MSDTHWQDMICAAGMVWASRKQKLQGKNHTDFIDSDSNINLNIGGMRVIQMKNV